MSSLTPESRARSICACRLVPRECCFERALNVFEKIVECKITRNAKQ